MKESVSEFLSEITLPLREKPPTRFKKQKVIVLAGPTAVGKTKHAIAIAKTLKGEIVSADSMQVYRGMDIGTAKSSKEEMEEVPHYLIDIKELSDRFNVMDFYQEATGVIRSIVARGSVPIVVGGTGFYINALIFGPPSGPSSVPEVRERLEKDLNEIGEEALYTRLLEQDPEYAKSITFADKHKIIRALEIIELTGKKVSDFPKVAKKELEYDFRCWFLTSPKEVLYQRIDMRCDEMIAAGFLDEVRELKKQGIEKNHNASQAIGYRQALSFLNSKGTHEDFDAFVAEFKRASRRYAKRQFTWFRKEPLFRWLDVSQVPFDRSCEMILQDFELGI